VFGRLGRTPTQTVMGSASGPALIGALAIYSIDIVRFTDATGVDVDLYFPGLWKFAKKAFSFH
jgi:hypothetical protein